MLRGEFELNGGADFHADSLPALLADRCDLRPPLSTTALCHHSPSPLGPFFLPKASRR